MEKGIVKGKLILRYPERAPFSEIMKTRPDIESLLAEIDLRVGGTSMLIMKPALS